MSVLDRNSDWGSNLHPVSLTTGGGEGRGWLENTTTNMSWDGNATRQPLPGNTTPITIPMGSLVSLNYSLPTMIVVAAVLFVVIVATAFGNFLVGLALFRYRYLRTVSNFLIGNLAVSDFLLATTILPLSTVNECLGHWVFGQVMCNFWLCTDVLYCTASIWNLCIIAFDRFTATLYPLWYREKRSTKQAAIYIALVWIISAGICVPPLLGWNDLSQNYIYDNQTNVYHCVLFQTPSYVGYSAFGSFFVPFIITFILYIRIFSVLRTRMRSMRAATKNHNQAQRSNHQKAAPPPSSAVATGNSSKPLLTVATKTEQEIEMTCNTATNDGSGNTEELSSKSLFGSDSGAEDEDEEEESSTLAKSDNPLCPSNVEGHPQKGKVMKNGLRTPNKRTDSSKADPDNIKILVMDESRDSDCDVAGQNLKQPNSTTKHLIPKNGTTTAAGHKGKAKKVNISTALKNKTLFSSRGGNAPKKDHKKSVKKMGATAKRKYEQREMRATIRMAIIIAFFCGMWLGFFTTYVIRGFCPDCFIPRELDAFFFWLGYSNSSVNPILYTIFNEEFRRAFQKILGCYKKGSRSGRGR